MKKLVAAILIISLAIPYIAGFLIYKKCSSAVYAEKNTEFCSCKLAPSPISEEPVSLPSESKAAKEKTDLTYIVVQSRHIDFNTGNIKTLLSYQTISKLYKGFPCSVFHPPLFS